MKKYMVLFLTSLVVSLQGVSQSSNNQVFAFYNLENLFDTIDQDGVNDTEYTPDGRRGWTNERYQNKVSNMSFVLNALGTDYNKKGVALVGVCEVENKGVLEDVVAHKNLKKKKWQIIHGDSPDKRGIDVALLYNPKLFRPIGHRYFNPNIMRDETSVFTRDVLLVTGVLKSKDTVHVLVNHWPSRRGGEEKSRPLRIQAAKANKYLIDSILVEHLNANVIVMGDLNDDPTNKSVKEVLKAKGELGDVQGTELYNPFEQILTGDEGSLKYQGDWNLFDQILFTKNLTTGSVYRFKMAEVYSRCYLIQQKGRYSGYPNRTFGGKKYLNGYSDHLPVMIVLEKD